MLECDVSDREDELRVQALSMSNGSSKRSKISKKVDSFDEWKFLVIVHAPWLSLFNPLFWKKKINKIVVQFFDDCNGVDHASVLRKLRSSVWLANFLIIIIIIIFFSLPWFMIVSVSYVPMHKS
jgi:hypothetical protein